MEKPDTITVVITHREEIRAHQADIFISAKASFLMTGESALKQVKELAHVVNQLTANGVKPEEIILRGVLAERNSPMIGPSNPATYLLSIHCPELEWLPELLVTITAQRNVLLEQLVWLFPDDTSVQARWLAICLSQARDKAQHIAANLGVKLLGVHAFAEKWTEPGDDQKRVLFSTAGGVPVLKASTDRNNPIAFPLVITKRVEIEVAVDFRVSSYD